MNKCVVCGNEFEALRPTKRTCSDTCRQKYHRNASTVTKIIPIVTKDRSIVTESDSIVTSTVTNKVIVTEGEKELRFTKDQPIEERIRIYKELYKESVFIPNWIAHGFLNKEDAIQAAIKAVNKNESIVSTGLQI